MHFARAKYPTYPSPPKLCFALFLAVGFTLPSPAHAQVRAVRTGAIEGVVTTQNGAIQLGGAAVVVRDASDVEVVTQATDADGHYLFKDAGGQDDWASHDQRTPLWDSPLHDIRTRTGSVGGRGRVQLGEATATYRMPGLPSSPVVSADTPGCATSPRTPVAMKPETRRRRPCCRLLRTASVRCSPRIASSTRPPRSWQLPGARC